VYGLVFGTNLDPTASGGNDEWEGITKNIKKQITRLEKNAMLRHAELRKEVATHSVRGTKEIERVIKTQDSGSSTVFDIDDDKQGISTSHFDTLNEKIQSLQLDMLDIKKMLAPLEKRSSVRDEGSHTPRLPDKQMT
jgi:hypothetical protein